MRFVKQNISLILVVVSISIQSCSRVVTESCFLNNKTFWSIFDSLGAGNVWQTELCRLTGLNFHSALNTNNISHSATASSPELILGSLGRAKKLVALKDSLPIDIVMFENVNDVKIINDTKKVGTINDEPWMQGEKNVAISAPMENIDSAKAFCNRCFSSILGLVPVGERVAGSMFTFPYKTTQTTGYDIKVKSKATADGELYILISGVKKKVKVTTAMSVDDIAKKIAELSNAVYGWTAINNGDNSVNISYFTNTTAQVAYDDNSTGVEVVITKAYNTKEYIMFYKGDDKDGWCDSLKWTDNISLYSCYKGLFEYLRCNLPEADLYLVLPTFYSVDFSNDALKNEDGTYNEELHYNSSFQKEWRKLMAVQREVAELYDIPVLDICNNSNINLQNIETYYPSNDVHPKDSGYFEWARTLCGMLKDIYSESEDDVVIEKCGSQQVLYFNNLQGVYYDLQGKFVTNPRNGIYIINGKKVIIK